MTTPNDTNTIDREAVAAKLDEARALIERGWTQEVEARDADGVEVFDDAEEAVCFCAVGALNRVGYSATAHRALKGVVGGEDVVDWNDSPHRTQADVIDAFKRAAAGVRSGEIAL